MGTGKWRALEFQSYSPRWLLVREIVLALLVLLGLVVFLTVILTNLMPGDLGKSLTVATGLVLIVFAVLAGDLSRKVRKPTSLLEGKDEHSDYLAWLGLASAVTGIALLALGALHPLAALVVIGLLGGLMIILAVFLLYYRRRTGVGL